MNTNKIACDGTVSEVQDLVAEVINEVPGFAGCAPDPENSGGYVINVTSAGVDLEGVRAAIIAHDEASENVLSSASLRAVMLDVSRASELFEEVPPLLLTELPAAHKPEWQWFSADLDEVHNQVVLLYADEEARVWAQQYILAEIEAPPGVVVASLGDPGQED